MNKFLVLYVLVLVAFLSSCATTVSNIKSVDELKGNRLLVGRFVFYVNDKLVKSRKIETNEGDKRFVTGFTVFFKKGDEKAKKFELDEEGYVYILADVGQYYITKIKHRSLWFDTYSFVPLHQSIGITVNTSDAIVNFGTIKVELSYSIASKVARFISPISPASLQTQVSDWDVPRQYISSKFNILPELIRDEGKFSIFSILLKFLGL